LKASTEREVESAFATVLAEHAGAMVVVADPFFFLRREQFVALARAMRFPRSISFASSSPPGG
jgi:putative ABC transport system substrate-binding protein